MVATSVTIIAWLGHLDASIVKRPHRFLGLVQVKEESHKHHIPTRSKCYRPLSPGTSPLRSTGISATRTTQWSWMTPSNGKIGLVLLVYASSDVDGLHESPCDSAPMYVTRSPVSSCPVPCAQYPVPCTL
jgi:hypothetical protein